MDAQKLKARRQLRRRYRVRNEMQGTAEKPRLSVFRSAKHIYAQLIDDINGVTVASASSSSKGLKAELKHGGNVKAAQQVGEKLADAAKAKGITAASFDRGHYRFHGRVLALAVAATKAGLVCCSPEAIEAKAAKRKEQKAAGPVKAAPAKVKGSGKKPEKAAK